MPANAVLVNFSGGETSPRSRGRFDTDWYQTSVRKLLNFIPELTGSARYRTGFKFCRETRLGQVPRLLNFQVNDAFGYELEFTPGFMRAYSAQTQDFVYAPPVVGVITACTKANPLVISCAQLVAGSPYEGATVVINNVGGMVQLNGNTYVLLNVGINGNAAGTCNLALPATPTVPISSSGFSVYTSGGIITKGLPSSLAITGLTNAGPAVVSCAGLAAGFPMEGTEVVISGVVGMPEINNRQVQLVNVGGGTCNLKNPVTGHLIDTTNFGAYVTGGVMQVVFEVPTPYQAADLPNIQIAVTIGGLAYLSCVTQPPQKLTVDSLGNFAIGTYTRTNDPFGSSATPLTVTGVQRGFRTQVSFASGSVINPNVLYTFSGVAGTTQLNGNTYKLVISKGTYKIELGGSWPIGAANGDQILLSNITGVLANQLKGGTFYVKLFRVSGTSATAELYYDAALTIPVMYLGSATGSFPSYVGAFSGKMTSGAASGATFTSTGVPIGFTNIGPSFVSAKTPTAYIQTVTGGDVSSINWGLWTSGGVATPFAENPIAVAFYEGRLVFAGTNQRPDCIFLSRSPDSNGNQRYDDFTGGSNADFACFFQLAPTGGSTDFISWARGGPDYLFVGTFGGPYRVSGSGLDIPITPSSINVRQFDDAGAEATMAAGLAQMFFVQRSGVSLRSVKVINPYLATFESADMCLNAEQIGYSAIQRVVLQRGRPDSLWIYRADGLLCNMSVKITVAQTETLTGWARHQLGGSGAVVDVVVAQRPTGLDQLWVATQRTIDGFQRCFVEIQADDVYFPDPEDFFTDTDDEATDLQTFYNILYRMAEDYIHVDASYTYDGTARGVAAGATLTPSAVGTPATTGSPDPGFTLTASNPVFTQQDVGNQIWKKPDEATGVGAGRATITAVDATGTIATCTSLEPFDSTNVIPAGDWYIAVSYITGLHHLENQQVAVVADGAVFSDGGLDPEGDYPVVTVTNGAISPTDSNGNAFFIGLGHIGFAYLGMLKSHNLEMGGRTGPAQDKPRSIAELFIRFMNSLGCEYGTDLYNLRAIEDRLSDAPFDRVAPVFSGIRRLQYEDSTSGLTDATMEKSVVILQRKPLPAVVQFLDVRYDTTDEG